MSIGMNEEKYFKILRESAVERHGEEEAGLLEPAIRDMAQSLAAIAGFPLEMEEEPAFYIK